MTGRSLVVRLAATGFVLIACSTYGSQETPPADAGASPSDASPAADAPAADGAPAPPDGAPGPIDAAPTDGGACQSPAPTCNGVVTSLDFSSAAPIGDGGAVTFAAGSCNGSLHVAARAAETETAAYFNAKLERVPQHLRIHQRVRGPGPLGSDAATTKLTFGCGLFLEDANQHKIEIRLELNPKGFEIDGENADDIPSANPSGIKISKSAPPDATTTRTVLLDIVFGATDIVTTAALADEHAAPLTIPFRGLLGHAEIRCGALSILGTATDLTIDQISVEICGP